MKIALLIPILSMFAWAQSDNAHANKPEEAKALDHPLLQANTVPLKIPIDQSVAFVDHAAQKASNSTEIIDVWDIALQTAAAITRAAQENKTTRHQKRHTSRSLQAVDVWV